MNDPTNDPVAMRRYNAPRLIVMRIKAGEFIADSDEIPSWESRIKKHSHFLRVLKDSFTEGLNLTEKSIDLIEDWAYLDLEGNLRHVDSHEMLIQYMYAYSRCVSRAKQILDAEK